MKPPTLFSVDAEESLLGSLLIDPSAFATVANAVSAQDVYVQRNRDIFEAIAQVASNGAVDLVAVSDALERAGKLQQVGGLARLTELITAVPSALHVQQYAEIVAGYATRRAMERAAGEVARAALDVDADVSDSLAAAEAAIAGIRRVDGDRSGTAAEVAGVVLDQFNEWMSNPLAEGQTRGIPTGIRALDDMLSGLLDGIYILAARPSMGKTAVMLQMVEGAVMRGHSALVFVIEASKEQTVERLATSHAGVSLQSIHQGRASADDYARVVKALGEVSEWPLTIIDQSTLMPADVLAHARRLQMRGSLDVIYIDGLWLMMPKRQHSSQRENIGSISREMKRIQRTLGVPVVMTHQLSRACEQRSDKRPILSDLRETGDVEQDGDVIMFLYREGYYDPNHAQAHVMETWTRKNRLGGPSNECAKMAWVGHKMRLEPLVYAMDAPPSSQDEIIF
jgi:replicative DNA helicase